MKEGRGKLKSVRGREVESRNFVSSVRKKRRKQSRIKEKLKAESADPESISDTEVNSVLC